MNTLQISVGLGGAIGALNVLKKQFPSTEDIIEPCIMACYAAVEALKDKKAYKPQPGPDLTYTTDCCCGNCDASIFRNDLFCRVCGSPVDWSNE